MKTIKTFNKKNCAKVELISDTFGLFVRVSQKNKTVNCYVCETMLEAMNMFWYCVCLWSGIDKYIK